MRRPDSRPDWNDQPGGWADQEAMGDGRRGTGQWRRPLRRRGARWPRPLSTRDNCRCSGASPLATRIAVRAAADAQARLVAGNPRFPAADR
jgi:hypothetical protein